MIIWTLGAALLVVALSSVTSQVMTSGGQRAIQFMQRAEADLTSDFMDDIIDKLFERVKCQQRISVDCKTCLTGAGLFHLLNQTSGHLSAASFEQGSKVLLCYARNLESMCQEHDDDEDFWRCDDEITSRLSDAGRAGAISAGSVSDMLSELGDFYADRADEIEDAAEQEDDDSEDAADEKEDDIDDDNDDDNDDLVKELDATLFSANCLSADKLFDELGWDDENEVSGIGSSGDISAMMVVHLVNGDKISPSCRTLPTRSSFLDDLYDDTHDKTSMNYNEFKELLEDLDIGTAQTAAASKRVASANNGFPVNVRMKRAAVEYMVSHRLHHGNQRYASIDTASQLMSRAKRVPQPVIRNHETKVIATSLETERCFSRDELLVIAKADKYDGVSRKRFLDICPALIQQQRTQLCGGVAKVASAQTQRFVYTTIAALIVCACSLLGAFFIPCMGKPVYQTAIVLFMGLAMGTLVAHSLMQLLPQAFGLHGTIESRSYRRRVTVQPSWFSLVSVAALYIAYVLECLVERSRSSSTEDSDDRKPETEIKGTQPDKIKISDVPSNIKNLYSNGVPPTVVIIAVTDIIHNLAAGLAIGVAFSFGRMLGLGTSISIILQHAAHELGQTSVLLNSGLNIVQTMFLRVSVSLVTLVGAYVGAGTGNLEAQKWIFAASAGLFLYIALSKIVPNVISAIRQTNFGFKFFVHNIGIVTGVALIICLCAIDMSYYP